ncbi:Protein kinase, partial [Globisporangium splendens]
MALGPHRVEIAAAPREQRIRELDDRDDKSPYQRLVTPNNSSTPTAGKARTRNSTNAGGGDSRIQEKSPSHQGITIFDDDDDDDDEEEDDDEDCGANEMGHHAAARRGSVRPSSTSTAMMLSESTAQMQSRMNPRRDLNKFTNQFQDKRLEQSYQLDSSKNAFPIARRIMLFLLIFELAAYLLFSYLKQSCEEATQTSAMMSSLTKVTYATIDDLAATGDTSSCFSYAINGTLERKYLTTLWLFSPFAFLFVVVPLKYFEGSMRLRIGVYYIRRRWKEIATVILLLWSIGMAIFVHQTLARMRDQFKSHVFRNTNCAANITIPYDWYAESKWSEVNKKIFDNHGMDLHDWIFVYDSKVAYSVIVAMLAALAALTGILSVSMKLDFTHVLLISASQSIATLVLIITGPSMSLNSKDEHKASSQTFLFVLCVLIPACVTLLATYSEDRASRTAYVSKLHAERINTTLKLDLSEKRSCLENRGAFGADEKEAMEEALGRGGGDDDDEAMALCHSVAIPFADLKLQDMIAKGPGGDVLLAQYHGTSVVFKRLAVSSLTSEGLKDFKVRVELLAMLRHPKIVQFIGATFDNLANVGLVLEYLERGDVFSLLRSSMALTWSDPLLKIATDVAQGVTYLHNCDPPLVHRDLKSSNLLCTPTYSCKLSDFGESKRQTVTGNLFSTIVGTPYWLAPEILREERYDVQVDCYSFGIVLIELETRKDPYYDMRDYNTVDIMLLVAHGDLRPTIPMTCSPYRRQLILRCLDSDPRRRPKMTEILSVLQNEVRKELLDQNSIDNSRDTRRLMLLQRHQMLNRRGVSALMLDASDE